MAVDVCSEVSSLVVSPRISFSHDLKESDRITPVPEPHPLISTIDFDFCITTDQIFFSSADELFANGKILPVEVKKSTPPKCTLHHSTTTTTSTTTAATPALGNGDLHTKRHMLKELLSANSEAEKPPTTKPPFWQFKRSSSENGRGNSLIRSLQFLSRSNSTGSAQNHKPSVLPRPIQRQNSKPSSCSSSSNNHSHPLSSSKKSSSSPLKKSGSGRSYGSVRISPVLNIPPAYISKATLFGLTSLFCNGKSKKKKK